MVERAQVYGFEMIHTDEIAEVLKRERALLVDLRDEESYRRGHIPHARNLPFPYLMEWKREIPERISLILYCSHGNQSLLAARRMKGRKGTVYTVIGGYEAYQKSLGETSFCSPEHKRD